MKKTKLQIVDLVVSTILVAGGIVASCLTKLGIWEIFYFMPIVIYEITCIVIAKVKGWI